MDDLQRYVPLLIPILVIQLGLMAAALWDLSKHPLTRGPRWMWLLIIVFVDIIGPVLYFAVGREDV